VVKGSELIVQVRFRRASGGGFGQGDGRSF